MPLKHRNIPPVVVAAEEGVAAEDMAELAEREEAAEVQGTVELEEELEEAPEAVVAAAVRLRAGAEEAVPRLGPVGEEGAGTVEIQRYRIRTPSLE